MKKEKILEIVKKRMGFLIFIGGFIIGELFLLLQGDSYNSIVLNLIKNLEGLSLYLKYLPISLSAIFNYLIVPYIQYILGVLFVVMYITIKSEISKNEEEIKKDIK